MQQPIQAMRYIRVLFAALLLASSIGCRWYAHQEERAVAGIDWQDKLEETLPLLGHRNWLLVVDKAYPAQTAPGVELIQTGGELPDVLRHTVNRIKAARHIKPQVFQDSELQYLTDSMVKGITALRNTTAEILGTLPRGYLPHDSLLRRTAEDGARYRIWVLKTECLLPYTSVFLQLDCGYWNAVQEADLRGRMPVVQTP